jgi:beta-alanine--pyruvate transaminase
MGAVFARKHIHDAFMQGPENAIELFHGYTYSAHPVACAAALASLDIYRRENLFARSNTLAAHWENAVHALREAPHVIDIRNIGLMAAIELRSREGAPTARAYEVLTKAYEQGLLVRVTGDTIALSPPLIVSEEQIDTMMHMLASILRTIN